MSHTLTLRYVPQSLVLKNCTGIFKKSKYLKAFCVIYTHTRRKASPGFQILGNSNYNLFGNKHKRKRIIHCQNPQENKPKTCSNTQHLRCYTSLPRFSQGIYAEKNHRNGRRTATKPQSTGQERHITAVSESEDKHDGGEEQQSDSLLRKKLPHTHTHTYLPRQPDELINANTLALN